MDNGHLANGPGNYSKGRLELAEIVSSYERGLLFNLFSLFSDCTQCMWLISEPKIWHVD